MAKTVAEQFVEVLAAAGVKRIYGIVGDSLNGLTDAIRRQGKIEWIHVRHEEVAAFAAPLSSIAISCVGSFVGGRHVWPTQTIASALSVKRCGNVCLSAGGSSVRENPGAMRKTALPRRYTR